MLVKYNSRLICVIVHCHGKSSQFDSDYIIFILKLWTILLIISLLVISLHCSLNSFSAKNPPPKKPLDIRGRRLTFHLFEK